MRNFLILGLLIPAAALGQTPTVGTLAFVPDSVSPGYTLYQPHNQPDAFLLNFCGEVVHRWEAADTLRPGNSAYLLPNGDLVRALRPAVTAGDAIWAGGGGATIERVTWDGTPVWSFTLNTATERLHHDFVPIPGGNVLALVWEAVDSAAAVAAGRLPELVGAGGVWPEKIIEIAPDGTGGAQVVWEWRAWDHLVQTTSSDLPNYGQPADHPHRIDVNFGTPEPVAADWLHANSIDYHPQLGHILVSIPTFDEVWIIDHAAPEAGLVWRWGNPAAYGAGTSDDRQLHYQHPARPTTAKSACSTTKTPANSAPTPPPASSLRSLPTASTSPARMGSSAPMRPTGRGHPTTPRPFSALACRTSSACRTATT